MRIPTVLSKLFSKLATTQLLPKVYPYTELETHPFVHCAVHNVGGICVPDFIYPHIYSVFMALSAGQYSESE